MLALSASLRSSSPAAARSHDAAMTRPQSTWRCAASGVAVSSLARLLACCEAAARAVAAAATGAGF
jgi:hypothetical protein